MTPKQVRFAEEYLIDLNATQAAIRAGYTPSTARALGYKLLRLPGVAEVIGRGITERSERTGIEADWVLEKLQSVAQRCLAAEPVLGRHGKPLGDYRFDAKGAIKALELMGKHLGMFSGKEGGPGLHIPGLFKDPREMSDEELAAEIAKLAEE